MRRLIVPFAFLALAACGRPTGSESNPTTNPEATIGPTVGFVAGDRSAGTTAVAHGHDAGLHALGDRDGGMVTGAVGGDRDGGMVTGAVGGDRDGGMVTGAVGGDRDGGMVTAETKEATRQGAEDGRRAKTRP
jgi:hypothetical protein